MLAQLMPSQRRVRVEPARQLEHEPIAISGVARQPERAAERQPVLMPIQLPDDLVVAARRIEIADPRPEAPRRAALVHRIVLPVDGRRLRSAEHEPAIAEQSRTGPRRCGRRVRRASAGASGKRSRIAGDQRPAVRRRQEESLRARCEVAREPAMRDEPAGPGTATREPRRATDPPRAPQRARCDSRQAPNEPRGSIPRDSGRCAAAPAELAQAHPREAGQHGHGEPDCGDERCRRRFAQRRSR